jgi:hypothetical protein
MSQVLKQAVDSARGAVNSQARRAHKNDELTFVGEPIIKIKVIEP